MSAVPIEARQLTKHFPLQWRRGKVLALQGVDFEVRPGEVFGLLGPNGSGKSTALKLVLGLIEPTAGSVSVFGRSSADLAARRRIGLLPEAPYFYRFLSGEETLRYFGRLCGVTGSRLEKRIDELIAMVGLEHGRKRPLAGYSKGMLQRIGLAQALVHDPELVLLDEPTAGVDPLGARDIKDMILQMKSQGKTIVLCSHLLEQVEEVCDRVLILHQGKKLLEGRLDELLAVQDETQLTVRGFASRDEAKVREALASHGVELSSVRTPRLTLEQLFLRKVKEASEKETP